MDQAGARLTGNNVNTESTTFLEGWRFEGIPEGTLEDCCLILATYRRPNEICELLETVNKMRRRPAEVVVVDGSPDDDTRKTVSGWVSKTKVLFNLLYAKSPKGLTRQRNAGIDLSSRRYVFFLDDDCIPQGDYFEEVRRVFIDDPAGDVGAVSGLIINEMLQPLSLRWRLRLALRLAPQIEPGVYHHSGTSVPYNLISPFVGVRPIDTLSGCTMTFRREVLEHERFSEFFDGYAQGEDLEISLRVRRRWSILWCGAARVIHQHALGGRPGSFAKGVMEVRNRHFIWKRHSPNASSSDKLRFWLDVLFLMGVDVGSFCYRPSRTYHLAHAGGLMSGAIGSIFSPPRFEEPAPRKQYQLCIAS